MHQTQNNIHNLEYINITKLQWYKNSVLKKNYEVIKEVYELLFCATLQLL